MKKTIIILLIVIVLGSLAYIFRDNCTLYKNYKLKKLIQNHEPAENTLLPKDFPVETNLPEKMPTDMILRYTTGGGEMNTHTEIFISADDNSFIIHKEPFEEPPINVEYNIPLEQSALIEIYNIFRDRGFDTIKTIDHEIIYDMTNQQATLSYTDVTGIKQTHKISIGATAEIAENDLTRWHDVMMMFENIKSIYIE